MENHWEYTDKSLYSSFLESYSCLCDFTHETLLRLIWVHVTKYNNASNAMNEFIYGLNQFYEQNHRVPVMLDQITTAIYVLIIHSRQVAGRYKTSQAFLKENKDLYNNISFINRYYNNYLNNYLHE